MKSNEVKRLSTYKQDKGWIKVNYYGDQINIVMPSLDLISIYVKQFAERP